MESKIIALFVSFVLLFGCDQKRKNFTTLDDEGNIVISEESLNILEDIEADYFDCKAAESDEQECNHFTAEAICRFYEIDDFEKNGSYVSYRDIKDMVTLNGGGWEAIGIASRQADLDQAQDYANSGRATIAFDPTKTNHVAIILPGKPQKSNSWGLDAPNSASFFVHKPDCYVNKALSYSFKSPEGIILYARK